MEQATLKLSSADIVELGSHFTAIARHVPLGPITSDEGYENAVSAADAFVDAGVDEDHVLGPLLTMLMRTIGDYDDLHHQLPPLSPASAMRFLMDQHGLRQRDLPEIGSQGVVSEILSGRRSLTVKQVEALSSRFGVSPAVFIG